MLPYNIVHYIRMTHHVVFPANQIRLLQAHHKTREKNTSPNEIVNSSRYGCIVRAFKMLQHMPQQEKKWMR